MANFFGNDPFISSVTSVIGTWQGVGQTVVGNTRASETAVVQFKSDGTFVEELKVGGNTATYSGTYSFNSTTDRISYIISSETPSTGPQAIPFNKQALSSPVLSFNGHTGVELNNDLFLEFKSTSVAATDFVLPTVTIGVGGFGGFGGGGEGGFGGFSGGGLGFQFSGGFFGAFGAQFQGGGPHSG